MKKTDWWETTPLQELSHEKWEKLCDNCGICCLHKLQDEETEEVACTNIACGFFDLHNSCCSDYANRKTNQPGCLTITYDLLDQAQHWLPKTCAYRRLYQGDKIPNWHPLITGSQETVKISIKHIARLEDEDNIKNLEDHIIDLNF
ncbi:MAG: putative cysteine cluster protein YcgN (CxxCxxCC family) [Francisellaceae bacterium]|jgi:uncharacterized cysteine cluster protein YcgN (CxxCxxCC family)